MKTNANFNLTHSLIDAVREVVAIEAKGSGAPKSAPKKKVATVMIAHGKGGGVKVIPKSEYDPKKHHLADEKDPKKEPKLDPVGKADDDVDNDGDKDKSDKFIHARRKAIAKSIAKKKAGIKLSGKSETIDVRPKMNEAKEINETDKSAKIASLKKKINDMEVSMADAKKRGLHDKHSAIGSYLFLYKRNLEKLQKESKMNEAEVDETSYKKGHGTPYDRGTHDAWHKNKPAPHKMVRHMAVTDLNHGEIKAYKAGYDATRKAIKRHRGR